MSRGEIEGHLQTIEHAWGIRIANRDQVRDWIAGWTGDPVEILSFTTSLNTWVALNQPEGSVQISRSLCEKILAAIRSRRPPQM